MAMHGNLTIKVEIKMPGAPGENKNAMIDWKPVPHPRCPKHMVDMPWHVGFAGFMCEIEGCDIVVKTDTYVDHFEQAVEWWKSEVVRLNNGMAAVMRERNELRMQLDSLIGNTPNVTVNDPEIVIVEENTPKMQVLLNKRMPWGQDISMAIPGLREIEAHSRDPLDGYTYAAYTRVVAPPSPTIRAIFDWSMVNIRRIRAASIVRSPINKQKQ